jgi:hypothetical protein
MYSLAFRILSWARFLSEFGDLSVVAIEATIAIAQSVQRLAAGWTTEGSDFESR